MAATQCLYWNYLALQLYSFRCCFISSIKVLNSITEYLLAGFLRAKYCRCPYLGLSVLCPTQLHTGHNCIGISNSSYYSSSLSNIQGFADNGTSPCPLSNLGCYRSHLGLGLLNSELMGSIPTWSSRQAGFLSAF